MDNYTNGNVSCHSNCLWDISECIGSTPTCGDNVVNQRIEECDGSDLQGKDCKSLGYESGDLICFAEGTADECKFDITSCIGELEPLGGGTCQITQTIESECEEEPVGLFIYSWTGVWTGTQSGDAYEKCVQGGEGETIECPAQVQLPFFDFYNVIIALALIGLIYFFLIRKKQRKTSKNKSSKKRKKK